MNSIISRQTILACEFDSLRRLRLNLTGLSSRANLIHPALVKTACAAYPRNGWSECFAKVIETELKLKPWCHTSTFEIPGWKEGIQSNFATAVRGNIAMKPFE